MNKDIECRDRKIIESCQRAKEDVEHEGDGVINCRWCAWNGPQGLGKMLGGIGNQRNRDYTDYSISKRG